MSENLLWDQIKEALQKNHQGKILQRVLDNIFLKSRTTSKGSQLFVLKVPSSFHQKFITPFLSDIQKCIKHKGFLHSKIQIEKESTLWKPEKSKKHSPLEEPFAKKVFLKKSFFSLYPDRNFSSFIQGPSNRFPFALAKSIANEPSKNSSNPLFIYGDTGLGKTHLLLSIGNQIEQQKPQLKIKYLPAERFFNECIDHILKNQMSDFRNKYRNNIHVLLLDDIQILGRGESVQDEFFYTFESLVQQGCQIVLASDRPVKQIQGLKARIQTRFAGGVVAHIQKPDRETKIAIIKNKAKKLSLHLSEEMLFYLERISTGSIREIGGSLNKIKMFCEFQKTSVSLDLVKKLFPAENPKTGPLTIKEIQKIVCSLFEKYSPADLKSLSRDSLLVQTRHLAMFLVREELNLPLSKIGRYFGGRHHTSVLHAIKNIQNQQKKNPELMKNITHLRQQIRKKT